MWTCALARGIVEKHAAESEPHKVVSFAAEFVGMVHCGVHFFSRLSHCLLFALLHVA